MFLVIGVLVVEEKGVVEMILVWVVDFLDLVEVGILKWVKNILIGGKFN